MPENASRERILGRIRAALRTEAPRYFAQGPSQIFPSIDDPLVQFQTECALNLTELTLTEDEAASNAALARVLESLPEGEIFVQDAPLLRNTIQHWSTRRPVRWSSEGAPAEASQATVTLAEGLVAQTGSIFTSSACGGRGASIVAPCHIVVAGKSQIFTTVEDALVAAKDRGITARNSFVGLISGSSRTADIEKIMVQGAHGPRRLVVVLNTSA